MNDSDETLVRRARSGDARAFEILLRRYFRAAYLVALAQLGEPSDAEDACQDAFVRSWDRLQECRDPARFGGWLLRIVRNTAHNLRKHRAVRSSISLDAAPLLAAAGTPESVLDRRELAAELRGALMRLNEKQREVVLLHDLEGWPHAAIAANLGISEVMSRRHLSDARKRLRELLARTSDNTGNVST